ncbi:MAG: enoyl-CoA hydratase/isomerase family protein, partial [Myxococcales bacterium]|nr:enoyl-CoA hydratase/isomerase family protein [Myxococcales bacterium]
MNLQRPPHQLVATVLGAGTMGAQIAAHLANAGVRTHLLDIVPRGVSADAPAHKRSAIALGALKIMAKARPAPFMDGAFADRIRAGNLEDDIERAVGESDLVIEAVVERLDIKQQLFTKVAAAAKPGAILASNTSGISIGAIAEGLPEDVRPRVVGMHFFNPPRYMYLLEVVPSRFTAPEVTVALANFSDHVLGKGVVICRDTPNFIGNRIGIAEMLLSFHATKQLGLTVEEVDLLNGPLVGRPKTASYRLGDVVGLDVVGHVIRNMRDALSGDPEAANYDEMHAAIEVPAVLEALLSSGRLGDKTGAGFYKKTRDAKGNRVILSLDLDTLEYREAMRPVFPELAEVAKIKDVRARVHAALRVEGRAGEFLRLVYLPLLNYAANRVGEICDDARQIDQAIRWGYAWQLGPFELFDAIGPGFVVEQIARSGGAPAKAAQELVMRGGANARWYGGRPSAPTLFIPDSDLGMRPIDATAGVIDLAALRDAGKTITGNASASLVDIGDGIACLEFHVPKMNILDEGVTALLASALTHVEERGLRGLVIGTAADNFCAGADLRKILRWAEDKDFEGIEAGVAALQATVMNLQHASVPVVAAARGMTLAGGLEVCLHCASIQAAAESYMGLVEVG